MQTLGNKFWRKKQMKTKNIMQLSDKTSAGSSLYGAAPVALGTLSRKALGERPRPWAAKNVAVLVALFFAPHPLLDWPFVSRGTAASLPP